MKSSKISKGKNASKRLGTTDLNHSLSVLEIFTVGVCLDHSPYNHIYFTW